MRLIIITAAACAITAPVRAEEFPSRPITVVVPSAAGSLSDILARLAVEKAAPVLGTTMIVDARPGAGGAIGSSLVARAEPDGHTILLANGSSHGAWPALAKNPGYDPLRDFVPIARVGETQLALIASKRLPVSNGQNLLAYARENPGKLTYATFGHGSAGHLFGEVMKKENGIDMVHVPFKGEALAVQALLAGDVDLAMIVSAKPYVEQGQVTLIGTTSPEPSAAYPGWPTLASQGVAGFAQARGFQAFVAPAGTAESRIRKLGEAVFRSVSDADVRRKLLELGVDPAKEQPGDFPALYRSLVEQWRSVVLRSGVMTTE